MSSESIDPVLESELRDLYEEVRRGRSDLLNSAKRIAPLVDELAKLQRHHNEFITALEEAQARLHRALDALPDSQLRSILAPDGLSIGVEPTEKELINWTYRQLRGSAKSESDLAEAYERRFALKPGDLLSYLSSSKFFRKSGVGDDAAWMISANREDDLRDYLAE